MYNAPRICIQTKGYYIEEHSTPVEGRYVFAYTVIIRNLGNANVQLIGRHWFITNGNGHCTEVQGEGVVGVQPIILPGNEFRYTSSAILETPLGTMEGYYKMLDHFGESFHMEIPVFLLAIPVLIH